MISEASASTNALLLNHNAESMSAIQTLQPQGFLVFRHKAMQIAQQRFNLWLK
jgi:hypothetical protein